MDSEHDDHLLAMYLAYKAGIFPEEKKTRPFWFWALLFLVITFGLTGFFHYLTYYS